MILDIHSHHVAPYPDGIVNLNPGDDVLEGQLYSVGLHPWDTGGEIDESVFETMDRMLDNPQVVALGEAGVDPGKGGPMFRQLQVFRRQIELSELHGKPLIIHQVKSVDVIAGLRRDIKPGQPWVIHGCRFKPGAAQLLRDEGFYFSFGPQFNPDTLRGVPAGRVLAETDDSDADIHSVIESMSRAMEIDMLKVVADNTKLLLHL